MPRTEIGRDIGFRELTDQWGFTGVVLACGAWRDRPLPIEGADAYEGRGLIYQNPFIIWFNHADEPGYSGPVFEARDGALVVGGGLASIDVVKVLMLETTRAKLRERGIEVDLVEMEVKGIPKTLERHGLALRGSRPRGLHAVLPAQRERHAARWRCPRAPTRSDARRCMRARQKMLAKAMEKYRFRFEPLCLPDGLIVENGQLVGLRFRRTKIEGSRVITLDETFERRGVLHDQLDRQRSRRRSRASR